MNDQARLGSKVRAMRRKRKLTQVELARRLGISPSYLNLIEHNQRSLTAPLLIKLAEEFQLDFQAFAADTDDRLVSELIEVFADPLFEGQELTAADVREFVTHSPSIARAVHGMYHGLRASRESADSLATRLYDRQEVQVGMPARMPSEDVTDFLQRHLNYFPKIEEAAERLRKDAGLDHGDSFTNMCNHLRQTHGVEVEIQRGSDSMPLRRFDPNRMRITISQSLPHHSRNFQLAAQFGLITQAELLTQLAEDDEHITDATSRALCRTVLANYLAGALLMPYGRFFAAAKAERYDIELLGHQFGTSFEQVCHRFTTLRRPGSEGIPFHMIRVDVAGNISKRFSASGIRFARFSGACPRWNIFSAFLTPGLMRVQLSTMDDGHLYFCVARTVPKGRGGYHAPHTIQAIGLGCRVEYAPEMIYSDGIDLETREGAVPVGVTCRLCDQTNCEQRAFPSIRNPLKIDENVRGISFYAPSE